MNKRFFQRMLVLLIFVLAACTPGAVIPEAQVPQSGEEPGTAPTAEVISGLDPRDILVQLDYEPTFSLPEYMHEFGRVPPFTLFADGTVIYVDNDDQQVRRAQLSNEEITALLQSLRDMNFASIESHTDMCLDQGGGNQECIADASYTIMRVRLDSGELREIRNYANFSNYPVSYDAIFEMLNSFTHPQAVSYVPEGATLFVQPVPETYGESALEWPLDVDILSGTPAGPLGFWAVPLQGEELKQFTSTAGAEFGRRFFEHEGQFYSVSFVPWLPGEDFSAAIQAEFPQQ
jgi:hypothetical protein